MSDARTPLRYELGLLLVATIWGVNFPAVKYALRYVDPLTFNAVRFTIAVAMLGLLLQLEQRRRAEPVERRPLRWLGLLGLGLLGHFAYQILFIVGLSLTTAGLCAFLVSTSPIWTASIGALTGSDRLASAAWLGLALAFSGASVLIFGRSGFDLADATFLGNLVSFIAAVGWGTFTAMSRGFLDRHSPTGLAFWTMLLATPLLWGVALSRPDPFAGMNEPIAWVVLAYSGLLSLGLAYILWNVGIRHVGPSHTAVFANLVPVVAFVIGVFWLGETGTYVEMCGAGMILLGLFVMRRSRRGHAPATSR